MRKMQNDIQNQQQNEKVLQQVPKEYINDEQWSTIFKFRDLFFQQFLLNKIYDYQIPFSNELIKSVILNKGLTELAEFSRQSGKTTDLVGTVAFLLMMYFPICDKFKIPHPELPTSLTKCTNVLYILEY